MCAALPMEASHNASQSSRKTREALEALQTAYELAGDKAGPDITGRLGIIYLRLGKVDDAIRYLRIAQGTVLAGQPLTAHVLVHLSNALAMRGQQISDFPLCNKSFNLSYCGHDL